MDNIFPNLAKTINPQLQEAQKFQAAMARRGGGAKECDNQITENQ